MPTPPRLIVKAPTVFTLSGWTVERVRFVLDAHERGDLTESSALADAFGRDPRIGGDLATRVRALTSRSSLPFTVEASDDGDGRRAESIAARVRPRWWDATPETELAQADRDQILLGATVGTIEWSSDWWPRLRMLPAHGLRFDEWTDGWLYQGRDALYKVTPGDGTWFLHLPGGARSWLGGAVRTLGLLHVMANWVWRDSARASEKHGMPVLAIEEPPHASDDIEGQGRSLADAFYEQFRDLGSEAVIREPQGSGDEKGFKARWLELIANPQIGFGQFLDRIERAQRLVLLGRDDRSGDKGISGDGASMLERVDTAYLASDAEPLSTSIREQIWMPWGRFNVPNWDDSLAPWGRWNTRPPKDLETRAKTLDRVADAITKLAALGADVGPILEEFQIARASTPSARPETTEDEDTEE